MKPIFFVIAITALGWSIVPAKADMFNCRPTWTGGTLIKHGRCNLSYFPGNSIAPRAEHVALPEPEPNPCPHEKPDPTGDPI